MRCSSASGIAAALKQQLPPRTASLPRAHRLCIGRRSDERFGVAIVWHLRCSSILLSTRTSSSSSSSSAFHEGRDPRPSSSGQPSVTGIQAARNAAAMREEAGEIARAVQHADVEKLLGSLGKLGRLTPRGGRDSGGGLGGGISGHAELEVARAWDASAHRALELSQMGEISNLDGWARILQRFASAQRSNAALLIEAERQALRLLPVADDAGVITELVTSMDVLSTPACCSDQLLATAALRLGTLSSSCDEVADVSRTLGTARVAALAAAYSRARLERAEIIDIVWYTLHHEFDAEQDKEISENSSSGREGAAGMGGPRKYRVNNASVAELALFCHRFERKCPQELHWPTKWLLPRVARAVGRCSLSDLAKLLPFLGAAARRGGGDGDDHASVDARVAMRRVVQRRLPSMLSAVDAAASADKSRGDASAVVSLLEALAVARERDLGLIMTLSTRCQRAALGLGASELLTAAGALAQLRVRHEGMLDEVADNLVVRHQRAMSAADVAAALRYWCSLRAPHAGLAEVAKALRGGHFGPTDFAEAEELVEKFLALKAPGGRLAHAEA